MNILHCIYLICILLNSWTIRFPNVFNWNLIVLISLYLSVYWQGKRMFPVTPFNTLSVLNIFWLKDVSHHHFWQCLSELKALSYISHVQRLVQKAISVGIPNSKFSLEIHRFFKKWRWGLYLEFSTLTLPKQPLARLSKWSCAHYFHNIHLRDHTLLKLWAKEVTITQIRWHFCCCCCTVTLFDRHLPEDIAQINWCRTYTHSDYLHFL